MKLSVTAKLILGIGASLILVTFVGLSSYLSLKGIEQDYKWVLHTEKVIGKTTEVVYFVREAESSQRGYVYRGDTSYFKEYEDAIAELKVSMAELARLVSDNENSYALVKKLEALVFQKKTAMADLVAIKDKKYVGTGNDLEIGRHAKLLMGEIDTHSKVILDRENALLKERQSKTQESIARTVLVIVFGTLLIFLVVLVLFRSISTAFRLQKESRRQIDEANRQLKIQIDSNEDKNWVLTGTTQLNNRIQGNLSVQEIAQIIIGNVSEYSGGKIGAIYLIDSNDKDILNLTAGYAFTITANTKKRFNYAESWVGQAAKDGKAIVVTGELIQNLDIKTGIVQNKPIESIIVPFYYGSVLQGLIEIGFTESITDRSKEYINKAAELIGIVIDTAKSREILHDLYQQTQQQAEELESQQEELRVSNEELISKTELLQASEEELRVQQEELRQINLELEEKARILNDSNLQITAAKDALAIKMEELEQANKYKSEFLANMSHELRTPLNSILILARILKDNKEQRLSEEEVKYANVIFRAGTDLLSLINDILDLSKIESGFLELNEEEVSLDVLENDLKMLFDEVARSKSVDFVIKRSVGLPDHIFADLQRLEQILKNLLSNAFKFTPKDGTVEVKFYTENNRLNIAVRDTGIGIPPEKQKLIFDAFQQADGATNREYGGTGLGLSISRELSKLMKAEILLESEQGKGSTFILSLPLTKDKVDKGTKPQIEDLSIKSLDKENVTLERPVVVKNTPERDIPKIMIIEDDVIFNDLLKEYAVKSGFETLQFYSGEGVEEEIEKHLPDAILLDVMLPGKDGWEVLKSIKGNPKISYIPVHIMSAGDFSDKKAMKEGAISFLKKPVEENQLNLIFKEYIGSRKAAIKKVLLVENQVAQSEALKKLFKEKDVEIGQAFTGEEAIDKLKDEEFDCVILDLNLPDIDGIALLERIKEEYPKIPVIINTAMELEKDKLRRLLKYSDATVIKSPKSSDRLIDEVNLFLHKIKETSSSEPRVQITRPTIEKDLSNRTVLLVDDDMRNIFALSAILDQHGLKVEIANDGLEGLNKLKELKKVDIVLMDIMMPGMDGYETMRNIRKNHQWKDLPIIALTAKAMKDDREKSIEAGANDYISKPVDTDQLIALIKIWIS